MKKLTLLKVLGLMVFSLPAIGFSYAETASTNQNTSTEQSEEIIIDEEDIEEMPED